MAESPTPTPDARPAVVVRHTPASARGGAMVWLMGLTLVLSVVLIVALAGLIVWQGARTFWPMPIERLELADGSRLLGIAINTESYDPAPEEAAQVSQDYFDTDGRLARTLYRVGNRDLDQDSFRWIPQHEITKADRPEDAVLVERTGEWGIWLGVPEGIILDRPVEDGVGNEPRAVETPYGPGTAVRMPAVVGGTNDPDSGPIERVTVLLTGDAFWEAFSTLHAEAIDRRGAIRAIDTHERSRINTAIHRWDLRLVKAKLDLDNAGSRRGLPMAPWIGLLSVMAGSGVGIALLVRLRRRTTWAERPKVVIAVLACVGLIAALGALLERPRSPAMTPLRLIQLQSEHDAAIKELHREGEAIDARIDQIRREDARYRVLFRDPLTGSLAAMSKLEPDEVMLVSQVVRAVPANRLSRSQRAGVYLSRWGEFLSASPRNANTEGGVFPVIVGTVTLTMLLTIVVVPLGVIAAIYLREYARQGPLTSMIRIAVNNLAGVPSIVYGVFGLGFFSYQVGRYIDVGPRHPWERPAWWMVIGMLGLVVLAAMVLGMGARRVGDGNGSRRLARFGAIGLWCVALVLSLALITGMPYFGGWFTAQSAMGSPTFGTGGILWAAVTLALLTLPVVIVATEEAISAVPRSLREGSLGCGASRWQTIRRIVLPGAMPGIMTGAILAVARGAGEVAPLMLVGAVKLADDLPVGTEFPFIHAEASFMHLGFHIFDLGFQSPDSQAARPLVWTTTLLLMTIVLALNLAAILVRSRLRARAHASL